jgi:hypothetical protein
MVVFADPAYNVPINGHVGGFGSINHRQFAMASGEMREIQFIEFLNTIFSKAVDGGINFVCMDWRHIGETPRRSQERVLRAQELSFYRSKHGLVFVFKVGSALQINTIELGRSGRYRTNVWDYRGANTLRPGRLADLTNASYRQAGRTCHRCNRGLFTASGNCFGPFRRFRHHYYRGGEIQALARIVEIDPLYVDVSIHVP